MAMMMLPNHSRRLPRETEMTSEKPELQPPLVPIFLGHPTPGKVPGRRRQPSPHSQKRRAVSPSAEGREGGLSLEIVCPAKITLGPVF